MKWFLNGAIFLIIAAPLQAAPTRKLPPVLPPHSLTPLPPNRLTPRGDARRATPKIRAARRKLSPLPPTGSKLSAKPAPRRPSRLSATGRANPDSQSVGLADQRLRENARAPLFSLEEAIALSLSNNPRRGEAQAAVDAATSNIGAVGAQGKFQVGANGTTEYGRNTYTSNALANSVSGGSSSGSSSSDGSGGHGFNSESEPFVFAFRPVGGERVSAGHRWRAGARFDASGALSGGGADLSVGAGRAGFDSRNHARLPRCFARRATFARHQREFVGVAGTVANRALAVQRRRLGAARCFARSNRPRRRSFAPHSGGERVGEQQFQPQYPARTRTRNAAAFGRDHAAQLARCGVFDQTVVGLPASTAGQTASNSSSGNGNSSSNGSGNSRGNSGGNSNGNSGGSGTLSGNGNLGGNGTRSGGNSPNSTNSGANSSAGTTRNASAGNGTTGNGAGAVFGGPSAPAGNTSNATIGPTNPSTPGASGNTSNPAGAGGATGTAGATNPTGAANPSGATTAGAGSASGTGGATATTGGTTGSGASNNSSTAGLSGGNVPSGASAGLQSLAGGTRQSLAVTQAQIGAAQAAIEIAKSGRRPQLGLNVGALLRNPATFLGNFGASIGLGLAQNLFDSGRSRNQIDTARAALSQLQARLAGQRLEVAGAIETSLLNLDSAQRRQQNADAGVVSAREALRVAQVGFRSGVRTTLDLADAQAALLSAQTDAVNARFDIADAQATLAAGVGIYTVEAQTARERAIRDQQEAAAQAQKQIEILQPKSKKRKKFLGIF